MLTVTDLEDLRSRVGDEIGVSDWHEVTQESVDEFARVTGDDQWIHTDPERARATPFGGTIAHGYYTLSLHPVLIAQLMRYEGFAFAVNYGLNKVRFPAPLPVGNRVRMRVTLVSIDDVLGGAQITSKLTFEGEGALKPVCVAEQMTRVYTR
ncbi:MAG TPA: MaoC family dehydratase [Solirubrobacteraceae bacterium]